MDDSFGFDYLRNVLFAFCLIFVTLGPRAYQAQALPKISKLNKSLNNLRSNLKVTSIKTAVHQENMIIILNYRDKQNSESVSSLITVWSDKLQLISDFENDLVITDFIFQENELYCLCHNKLKIFKLQNSKPKLNQVLDLDNLGKGLETFTF